MQRPSAHTNVFLRIAVIIPAYKARDNVLNVIRGIGPEVSRIYLVDDGCPDGSADHVLKNCTDQRLTVIRHPENRGVGAAVMTGYRAAICDGMDILIKIDSDGQMDPALIPDFAAPLIRGEADYAKGNRFFDIEGVQSMPRLRLFGNAALSFLCKLSSGYWNLFDPTNGYTALHADVARRLPFDKISQRYFFESDMLFRLNTLRAVAVDVPMFAKYGGEQSHLRVSRILPEFVSGHMRNSAKRIFYNYYLRDMSVASIELPFGFALLMFGLAYGIVHWLASDRSGTASPAGTVMLSALPVLLGIQFILAFFAHDMRSVPMRPLHRSALTMKLTARESEA